MTPPQKVRTPQDHTFSAVPHGVFAIIASLVSTVLERKLFLPCSARIAQVKWSAGERDWGSNGSEVQLREEIWLLWVFRLYEAP